MRIVNVRMIQEVREPGITFSAHKIFCARIGGKYVGVFMAPSDADFRMMKNIVRLHLRERAQATADDLAGSED